MTNLEHFKKRINEMSAEEIGDYWQNRENPWCDGNCRDTEDACIGCVERWANQPYINPMPELKTGMFVECNTTNGKSLGVVINNNRTVFQNGVWTSGINNGWGYDHITKVFSDEVTCFDMCHDEYIIWRRD